MKPTVEEKPPRGALVSLFQKMEYLSADKWSKSRMEEMLAQFHLLGIRPSVMTELMKDPKLSAQVKTLGLASMKGTKVELADGDYPPDRDYKAECELVLTMIPTKVRDLIATTILLMAEKRNGGGPTGVDSKTVDLAFSDAVGWAIAVVDELVVQIMTTMVVKTYGNKK